MPRPFAIMIAIAVALLQTASTALAQVSAAAVIEKYEKTESAQKSRHITSENLVQVLDSADPNKKRFVKNEIDVRTDGTKVDVSYAIWELDRPDAPTPDDRAFRSRVLWDGTTLYEYHRTLAGPNASYLAVTRDPIYIGKRFFSADRDRMLIGVQSGDFEPISSIIRTADRVELRRGTEPIGDVQCHLIDVTSKKNGDYTLWIDPDHGYNLARAKVQKGPGQLYFGQKLPQPNDTVGPDEVLTYSVSLDNVRFEKLDQIWLPMSADFERISIVGNKDRTYIERGHHRRTKLEISPPDLTAPGAFQPDFPNGVRVFDMQQKQPAAPLKWQDGKIVPTGNPAANQP